MKNTAIWCIFLALLNTLTMGNDPCSGPLRNLVSGSVGVCSKDPPTPLPKQVCYSEYWICQEGGGETNSVAGCVE